MGLLSIEHGKLVYWGDFAVHGLALAALTAVLAASAPSGHLLQVSAAVLAGLLGWTAIEYGLHRFVLHGVQPFQRWHRQHHERPMALMGAPTLLTASLLAGGVFLPAWAALGLWRGTALTFGLLAGYLAYGLTHHATHHWRAEGRWFKQRKRWHAWHHHGNRPGCYGVTTSFWDHVFGSAHRRAAAAPC